MRALSGALALLSFALVPRGGMICRADAAPTAALVLGAGPEPNEANLRRIRQTLARDFRLIEDPKIRAVTEGFAHAPSAKERVTSALERAHSQMRRFDLEAVRQSIDDAEAATRSLSPTAEGRALAAKVALRRAELAMVEHDLVEQSRAMALALSAEPSLQIDLERDPPTLAMLAERVRAEQSHAPRASLRVVTDPPGADLYLDGAARGRSPIEIRDLPKGPHLIWATHAGHSARVERVEVASAAEISLLLPLLDEEQRIGPLVEAVRAARGEDERASALALASSLGVDVVAVLRSTEGDRPTLYRRTALVSPPSARESNRRPWYRRGWVWGVAGSVLVTVTTVGLAVGLSGGHDNVSLTCCK